MVQIVVDAEKARQILEAREPVEILGQSTAGRGKPARKFSAACARQSRNKLLRCNLA